MNAEPLLIMIIVQSAVTSMMLYCFYKVLKKQGK